MTSFYLVPKWFYGVDVAMEIAFALVTLLVAFVAFKIYRVTDQEDFKFFGASFGLISLSYILWAGINLFLVSELQGSVKTLGLSDFRFFSFLGIFLFVLFFLLGLITLVYTVFKVRDIRIYALFFMLVLLLVSLSENRALAFYFTSFILLGFLLSHYGLEYRNNPTKKKFSIFFAFILLFISPVGFLLSEQHYIFYVVGHVLELIAYSIILVNILLVLKHEQKKK